MLIHDLIKIEIELNDLKQTGKFPLIVGIIEAQLRSVKNVFGVDLKEFEKQMNKYTANELSFAE